MRYELLSLTLTIHDQVLYELFAEFPAFIEQEFSSRRIRVPGGCMPSPAGLRDRSASREDGAASSNLLIFMCGR